MGSKTKMINGEMITEFAKDTDTSNKAIFKQALLETVVESWRSSIKWPF